MILPHPGNKHYPYLVVEFLNQPTPLWLTPSQLKVEVFMKSHMSKPSDQVKEHERRNEGGRESGHVHSPTQAQQASRNEGLAENPNTENPNTRMMKENRPREGDRKTA
jgi:hypothetical protein